MKKLLIILLSVLIFSALVYLAIFGRALRQSEDHLGILLAMPKILINRDVARVDDDTYLVKNTDAFVKFMEGQGYVHVEQLGSGHFFKKDDNEYVASSRMYSSYFLIFTFNEVVVK